MAPVFANEELTWKHLPEPEDHQGIINFAMTFNGYEAFGSFDACAAAARAQKRDSLAAFRNELFFSVRASRHRQDDAYIETYVELLPLFRSWLPAS